MDEVLIQTLVHIVNPQNAIIEGPALLEYGSDATKISFRPDLVLFPSTPAEIVEIVKLANQHRFPVVPRGAGTGMSGGALPVRGGVVIGLERMDRILEIDPKDGLCVVEPGVKTLSLQREVERYGLFYPPDPASAKDCTIGGNIAECAGGLRAVKYGVTRDYVLGLEVVLPSGELIVTGGKTLKGVVGYDLTRLMVGSEGTLGIVTKAILKLIPKPETKATIFACFPNNLLAVGSLFGVLQKGILPSAYEFMDHLSYSCLREKIGLRIPYKEASFTIVELDGRKEQVQADLRDTLRVLETTGKILDFGYEGECQWIWDLRRELSPSLYRLRPNKANEDVAVPRARLSELLDIIGQISKETGLPIPVFGHIGDGNLHVNIMYDKAKESEAAIIPSTIRKLLGKVLELGGTISGEHGIGITKAPYLDMELSSAQLKALKAIKAALDPNNIMNPYKIIT